MPLPCARRTTVPGQSLIPPTRNQGPQPHNWPVCARVSPIAA